MIFFIYQIIVKKSYGDKRKRRKQRTWKLKGLAKDTTSIDPDILLRYSNKLLCHLNVSLSVLPSLWIIYCSVGFTELFWQQRGVDLLQWPPRTAWYFDSDCLFQQCFPFPSNFQVVAMFWSIFTDIHLFHANPKPGLLTLIKICPYQFWSTYLWFVNLAS